MTVPLDAKQASVELVGYVTNVLNPPSQGAELGDILGAYIFKAVLRDAGYAIVPLTPSRDMEQAYRSSWLRSFKARYQALLDAAWPEHGGEAA